MEDKEFHGAFIDEKDEKRVGSLRDPTLAETEGFEPSIPFGGIHTFQACSFNHSDKSPVDGRQN